MQLNWGQYLNLIKSHLLLKLVPLALTDGFGSIAGVIRVAPLALDSVGFWGLVFLYGTSMELFGGFALWYCIGNITFVI